MKFIVLLRHGIAEDKRPGMTDADRALTSEGRKKMKEIARALASIFPEAEAIWSSPLLRAMQTAEAVAAAWDPKLRIEQTDALESQSHPAEFRKLLPRLDVDAAIFTGHEPNMTEIMTDLTGVQGALSLKKGGFYGVRMEDSPTLEWMVPPRVARVQRM